MRQRKVFISLLILLIASAPIASQAPERMDELLEQDALDRGQAAYIAAASAGVVDPDASDETALEALVELGFSSERAEEPQAQVRLDEFSYMSMLAHDISGGLMYTILPGPRYAYRELRHEGVFSRGGDPATEVSGEYALRTVGRVLSITEARQEQ